MMNSVVLLVALICTASAFSGIKVASRSHSNIVMMAEKSKALPFMPRPPNLEGMVGDVGKID